MISTKEGEWTVTKVYLFTPYFPLTEKSEQ